MTRDTAKAFGIATSALDRLRAMGFSDDDYEFTLLARYKGHDEARCDFIVSTDDLDAASAALAMQADADRRRDSEAIPG